MTPEETPAARKKTPAYLKAMRVVHLTVIAVLAVSCLTGTAFSAVAIYAVIYYAAAIMRMYGGMVESSITAYEKEEYGEVLDKFSLKINAYSYFGIATSIIGLIALQLGVSTVDCIQAVVWTTLSFCIFREFGFMQGRYVVKNHKEELFEQIRQDS